MSMPFLVIGNCFPLRKKRSAKDAHSRERYMIKVSALGARMSQATFFIEIGTCKEEKYKIK